MIKPLAARARLPLMVVPQPADRSCIKSCADVSFTIHYQRGWTDPEQVMPTVAKEGQFRFVVNPQENKFEPPHVHVWVGNEDVCRIELNSSRFMDEPPPGDYRRIL